jgi:hypothetical protein
VGVLTQLFEQSDFVAQFAIAHVRSLRLHDREQPLPFLFQAMEIFHAQFAVGGESVRFFNSNWR